MSLENKISDIIELQLGDIIQITDPINEKLNNQIFIIDYIDKHKMFIINTDTLNKIKLNISNEGIIGDGTITKLSILSRNETPSYAKENGLTPGKWINIHFGGDYPVIITGEITNLENDMIEIKTIDNDILYINFDYKGIPEDLPIDLIEIREKPQTPKLQQDEIQEIEETGIEETGIEEQGMEEQGMEEQGIEESAQKQTKEKFPTLEKDINLMPTEQIRLSVPVKNIKDQLREFILMGDQIKFGNEELGPIVQYVDVSSKSQRYSIETQVSDLLDDLLSTIPNIQRTQSVLNNIHIVIERFKQLRENFSYLDQYGNVEGALVNESTYKPILSYFKQFKMNLYWILPVVKNIKKIYNSNETIDETTNDIVNLNIEEDVTKIKQLINTYRSNNVPLEQNKYSILYDELNPFFTPFDMINEEDIASIIYEKSVESDINVIIDNLEDMYSSIFANNNVRTRRFVLQKYNTSLTKLNSTESKGSRLIATRVNMTAPDVMSIKSFVTLPEPTIRFSKINLPGTNILERANMNLIFLNYWQFLKKKTNVSNVFIESLDENIEFNENNFVNNVKNYILNLPDEIKKGLTQYEIYRQFIKTIIPKTRVLFELIKKYIVGKLSIVEVVSYLEPFLIYTDDLTYMQYIEIIKFIADKINQYNKNFIERSRLFALLNKINSEPLIFTNAYSIISALDTNSNIKTNIKNEVFESYDIDINSKNIVFTNSEILRNITLKDYTRLYTTAISLKSIPLMYPSEFSTLFNDEKNVINSKIETEETKDKCKTFTISKYYTSVDELKNDNNKEIYFDKKYDKTDYGKLDNYEKEMLSMSPENFIMHLTNELIKKDKLNQEDAEYLSETLIDGHKRVLDGHYAILYKGYSSNVNQQTDYYIRKNNQWELDKDIEKDLNTDDSNILCNLQEKCISVPSKIDDKCESLKIDELSLQDKVLKDVINEFDTKYKMSKDEFEKNTSEQYKYYLDVVSTLMKIETNSMLKYNNQKYSLGANIDETSNQTRPISPFEKVLNLILMQKDFIKKQNDIIRFVNSYTRQAIVDGEGLGPLNEKETPHWLYCIKTNVPILPTFRYDMAVAFTTNPAGYANFIDLLISKIGKLSEDGDWWTDEHSGWSIIKIDYDYEEGYEEGFKVSTRGLLEEDAGNKITSAVAKNVIYITPETKMISNIVNALSVAMGINIEIQKEFIINCVLTSLRDLEKEDDYKVKVKEMIAKNKKMMSYKDFYNTALMYYTLSMYLIAIQTAVPSIKTRKTHPGCVRSFDGFPFEGTGDLSSVAYLACVAYDIRSSSEPWNVLKSKKQEYIRDKIVNVINSVLINLPDVKRKIEDKTEYLLTSPAEAIPKEHDISLWTNFLPPLVNFKIKKLNNITEDFKRSLMVDLRNGSIRQNEKILVIYSKIILFSLAIQERVNEITKKKALLLHKANNEPYLENSCCDSKEKETTIEYFIGEDNRIAEYNNTVNSLSNIIKDIISYTQSGLFYSKINTKNKYPAISQDFDEITIYLSFIYFCKFRSLMPIPDDLLPLCTDKPDLLLINKNDSIGEIIKKLKNDGRQYNSETFLRLLQLVGRNNIVDINMNNTVISSITKLKDLLESIEEENDEFIEGSLIKLINNTLDTFDIATNQTTKEVKELNNYLIKHIENMKLDIIDFIDKNRGTDITRNSFNKSKKTIELLSNWKSDNSVRNNDIKISDDFTYNVINFYKNLLNNFVNVFPNIILNKVDYTNTNIPNYLGLSAGHAKKIKDYINDYYETLRGFYGIPAFNNVLETIQKSSKNLLLLSKITPTFTSIKYKNKELKPVFDERTSKLLHEFYLLKGLINYMDLADDSNMIVTETRQVNEVEDLYSVDYIEERETRVNFDVNERNEYDTRILRGNTKELKQKISKLLVVFIGIMENQKDVINVSYEEIMDRIFKLKEKEKDIITDRLKILSDEERDADTILKINKLGVWSKGLQKGLTTYVKETYDEEREFRDEMEKTERNIRKKNKNATNDNIEQYMEDYIDERERDADIEREAYDMSYITEDFMEGNMDGTGAPEDEYEDYQDYDS
jgi:hypothetical protein